ncbi:MAG: elongation factor P [Acidimicrobiia bacterium]|nr:elongation factor P [Acidimicrobiia bacterium]MDH5503901.1 elongation factor P [Acidimicrobiia bacterium]
MISTNDVKPGMAISIENGLFTIIEYQHVKPGKGKAFVRLKLKNAETGAVIDRTFRAGEDVDRAVIDRKDHQFLYQDELGYHFMDLEEFSQFAVSEEDVGDAGTFLVEGATVVLPLYESRPIGVELPASVELEVTFAEPGVKGDRSSGGTKPVTVQTGRTVHVPLFIETGDVIKVDTRTGEYMTRV